MSKTTMTDDQAIRMMNAMADMIRDLRLSGTAAEKLLRTNAELISDVDCGADDMLERLVRSVQEIILEKDSGAPPEGTRRRHLAVAHMAQDLELVRKIQKICADEVSGRLYNYDTASSPDQDIRAMDPLAMLMRARLGYAPAGHVSKK